MADLQPVSAVARLLDVSERAVYDLARHGTIPRAQRGRYDLVACVRAYIRHLREVAAGRTSHDGALDLVAERARLAREQADGQSMKNALLRSELLPRDDMERVLVALQSGVQKRLLSVPSNVATLVARETSPAVCQRIVDEHIREALQELAEATIRVLVPRRSRASNE